MKLERNTIIVAVCITISGLIGIYSDFFLSLEAYQINSTRFVMYESNQEIIKYFTNNDFPFIFYMSVITFPIAAIMLARALQKYKESKYVKGYLFCLIMFTYASSMSRLSAGLTWFANTRDVLNIYHNTAFISLGALGCFLYVMIVESKENEQKINTKNDNC